MASNLLNSNTGHLNKARERNVTSVEKYPAEKPPRETPAMTFPPQDYISRGPRKLVLCFDGTGNKFHGDDSDSNILKIFRMLDRTADDQYHYYQPGIGTYVVSSSLSHTSMSARLNSWYQKAKDSAVGSSFDVHVVGGYRFLMRFYNPGDEIYMFGFSRGAYIARFLAEMLDYIGLLSHGNEEMVNFAWKAFAQWQSRPSSNGSKEEIAEAEQKKHQMYHFMKGFRETFSRPVGRIRFLGLFDTVNSVPRFETAWMQRSKFPYTARSSAKVIRHAVSIDERRAKFRQDLMYQGNISAKHHHHHHHRPHLGEVLDQFGIGEGEPSPSPSAPPSDAGKKTQQTSERGRQSNQFLSPGDRERGGGGGRGGGDAGEGQFAPYRASSRSRQKSRQRSRQRSQQRSRQFSHFDAETESTTSAIPPSEIDPDWDEEGQDMDEVWFSGGHGDIGGGWDALPDRKSSSHVPLTWIVREAMKAGLPFDLEKVAEMGCLSPDSCNMNQKPSSNRADKGFRKPTIRLENEQLESGTLDQPSGLETNGNEQRSADPKSDFHEMMDKAHVSFLHDSLAYNQGLGKFAVSAWKFMEYLPFRRMDLQSNGSWKPIRWPLPRGEVRDIPDNVRVHGSVIRRMKMDDSYRPGNLIIGGGGRGVRHAPKENIGDWECVAERGDPVGEIWVKKPHMKSGSQENDAQEK